ncbi:DeoR/GlpR family DNA-binding transcription regulator [Egibacter rhizosphaerae]|nr:DeoR/GlpR family DNA-binding transcription regulator [Egibacter rhizosphaerae]
MQAEQRRQRILAELALGEVQVATLCARLEASEATIRRDLRVLVERGQAQRTYGGAAPLRGSEPTVREKAERNVDAKHQLAAAAAASVRDGDMLVLDAGTTTARLASELHGRRGLTVLTNGLSVLDVLREHEDMELIVVGGAVRSISQALLGPVAESAMRLVQPDHAFIGADGVHPQWGVNCASLPHSSWKQAAAQAAQRVTVLADASKLMAAPYRWWAPMPSGTTVLSNHDARADQQAPFVDSALELQVT